VQVIKIVSQAFGASSFLPPILARSAPLEDLVQIGQVRHLNDVSLGQETLRRKEVLPDGWEDDVFDLVEFWKNENDKRSFSHVVGRSSRENDRSMN